MIMTLFNPRSKSAKTRADIKAEEAAELEKAKVLRAQKELAAFATDVNAVLLTFISSVLHYRPSDPSLHRRRRVFAPSLGSGPRTLARLTHFLRRSQPKVDEPTELQQRPGPSTSSHCSPPIVEVPALDDKKALYTAWRPERAIDKAKRIKNLKLWSLTDIVHRQLFSS
ncbi:hypothetical protein EDD22DRAFT_961653 [Suillus occidentalis]|nr:hypothetical protein EDD22DRAFT_961653 [Suillus occidentalis]